jgi:hypothetical protein
VSRRGEEKERNFLIQLDALLDERESYLSASSMFCIAAATSQVPVMGN